MFKKIKKAIKRVVKAVRSAVSAVVNAIKKVVSAISKVVSGIYKFLTKLLGNWITIALVIIAIVLSVLFPPVAAFFATAWTYIVSTFSTLFTWVGSTLGTAWSYVSSLFANVWSTVAGWVTRLWEFLSPMVETIIGWAKKAGGWIALAARKVGSYARQVWEFVKANPALSAGLLAGTAFGFKNLALVGAAGVLLYIMISRKSNSPTYITGVPQYATSS